jgi:glutamate-1-semialdehyde 2,1-aminomutase
MPSSTSISIFRMAAERPKASPHGKGGEEKLIEKADELLAWGNQHRVLLRPLYDDERGIYPEAIESAEGYELVDVQGRRFIDWTGAWGPVMLGYRHPAVEDAIKAQLQAGPLLPLMHRIEVEVAETLVDIIPCAEMVAFGKNGSDVTTAAIRIARAATGRDLILQWGFHGYHDWYTCRYRAKNAKGIPTVLRSFIHSFEYNDLGSLQRLFNRYPEEIAAVIMEPVTNVLPEPGFLEGVKELAHRNGALLIFDEVVTGFRLANGGAQEHFGVIPDLACFGKAIANGMPLAAIVGRQQYMKHLPSTAWGMTYRGETLSLAAASAVLELLQREPVTARLVETGTRLRDGFHEACSQRSIEGALLGPPARMAFEFGGHISLAPDNLRTYFLRQCAAHGVLTNGMILPSYAHDDSAVERTLEAFGRSLDALYKVLSTARIAVHEAFRNGFTRPKRGAPGLVPGGWFDSIQVSEQGLEVMGWILGEQGALDSVELVSPSGQAFPVQRYERPDLVEAFPDVPRAAAGGYWASLPARAFARNGGHEFTLVAKHDGSPVFSCHVVRSEHPSSTALPTVSWNGEALHL